VNLGKPTPNATNTITVDLRTVFAGLPPGTIYLAGVSAVGPGGTSASTSSNTFEFSAQSPAAGMSPDGTMVPPASQIVDNVNAVWTIGAGGVILRNNVQAAGGWGSKILWKNTTIYVLGTDNNWWQWTGAGWRSVGPSQPGGATSPDGTMVPPAAQIVDNAGAIWTIGTNQAILRNGVQASSGRGSQIFWKNTQIYVLGTDNNWWQWTATDWVNIGPSQPGGSTTSPNGTLLPPATQIVDNVGAIWTIGAGGAILRNTIQAAGGWGSQILWTSNTIYVLGSDNNWWQWTGAGWINIGANQPGGATAPSPSPDGTSVPPATQIVDNSGAVWTIGAGGAILRNAIQAAGGWGSQILWKNTTIYVLGSDNNWWQWTASSWINIGPSQPGGTTSANGTMVPPAAQIVDNVGAIWSIGAGGVILRNAVQAADGLGSTLLWKNATIYVLGMDNNWWQWTGSGWIPVGPSQP
jgi:hypothetical protein